MNNFYKSLFVFVLIMALGACEDILDKDPLDRPSNETFYSTQDELLMAINASYNFITAQYFVPGPDGNPTTVWPHFVNAFYRDHVTDIAATRLNGVYESFKRGDLNTSSVLSSNDWAFWYVGIARTNALLANMSKAESVTDPVIFRRIRAEARTIRAIAYMNLINDYGDVPLVTESISTEQALELTRTPKAEVLAFVFNEFDAAAIDLPTTYTGNDRGRITRGGALAMKARIALYMKDYPVAKAAAKAVMDLNVYRLHSSYRNLFTYSGQYSSEIIMDFQFKNAERTNEFHLYNAPRNSAGQSQSFPTEDIVASFECTDGLPIDESPMYNPRNPFVNRDPRLRAAVIVPRVWNGTTIRSRGTIFNGIEFMSSKETLLAANGVTKLDSSLSNKEATVLDSKTGATITNQEVTNGFSSFTGYCMRKYMDSTNVTRNNAVDMNFIISRYAEVLLIYAEASVELGQIDQSVLDAINMIRARAYGNTDAGGNTNINANNYPKITSLDQAGLRKVIRRERKTELCFEGFRMDDLRRWGLLTQALSQHVTYGRAEDFTQLAPTDIPVIDDNGLVSFPYAMDSYGITGEEQKLRRHEQYGVIPTSFYLFPIPQGERQLNPGLGQNPGY